MDGNDSNAAPPATTTTVQRVPPNRMAWGAIKLNTDGGAAVFEFARTESDAQKIALEMEMGSRDFVFVVNITGERVFT